MSILSPDSLRNPILQFIMYCTTCLNNSSTVYTFHTRQFHLTDCQHKRMLLPFKVTISQVLHILYTQTVPPLSPLAIYQTTDSILSLFLTLTVLSSHPTVLKPWTDGPRITPPAILSLSVHMNAGSNIHVTTSTCNKCPDLTQTTEVSNRRQE